MAHISSASEDAADKNIPIYPNDTLNTLEDVCAKLASHGKQMTFFHKDFCINSGPFGHLNKTPTMFNLNGPTSRISLNFILVNWPMLYI